MSYGARYHVQHKVLLGGTELTFLAEVLENGYAGGSTRLEGHEDAGVFSLEYEKRSPDEIRKTPILKSRLELYFVVKGSTELGILDTIFGSDDSKYRMRLSLDGSKIWEGPVVTDLVERPTGRHDPGTITAKDFTRLPSQDYALTTGRDTIATVFADVLGGEGLGFGLKTIPSFSNANTSDSDDWMNQISLNKRRIRKFAGSADEEDQPHNKWKVLETMARNFQTLLFQSAGSWYLIQLTGDANDPATVYTYNSSGTQQSSASVDLDALVDKSTRWLLDSSQYIGTPGISKVTMDFNHQSTQQFQSIPDIIAVTENEVNNVQNPVPFFQSDGSQKIKFNCGVEADSNGDETSITARIEFRVGESGNYYYLVQNDSNNLEWSSSQDDFEIELDDFSGGPDGPTPGIDDGQTIDSSGTWIKTGGERGVSFTTPNIPADADGDIQITFRGAVDQVPNVVPETRYYGIAFTLTEENAEADSRSVTYEVTQDGDYSGVYELGETWFGDGPAAYSVSALTWDDGGNARPTNNDWRRVGGTAELKFHEVLGREIIDTQRTSTEVIRATLLGSYKPHQVLTTDGGANRYVFIGGRLTGADAIWQADFLNINVDTDGNRSIGTIVDDPDDSTGSGGGGGGNSEDPQAIAELTSDVSGSGITAIDVNVYAGKAIESGKDYYIWNRAKKAPISFTALEDLDSGDANLDIEEQAVVAPSGSKIYKEEGQKETERIIQVEQQTATESARASLSLSVKNERQATSLGTTVNQVSGTVTSIDLESIPFEVKVEDGDVLTILSTEDSDEGNSEEITVNGDQTLTAGTGTLSIESIALSNTYPAGSAVFEPAVGLTSRISLVSEVTTSNSSSIASLETDVSALESTLVLKAEVTSGEITKLAFIQLDASIAGGSAITLAADQINISGDTTFTNGYDPSDGRVVIRSTSAPTQRPSGDDLKEGDIWLDTDDGDKPYSWNGSSWVAEYTNIDGGNIVTGAIESGNFVAGSTGWQIDTNGDAEFNSVTIRDGTIIDPDFQGAAVGLINTVSTFANLPTGAEDGDTYYVEDEPGGLYVWRDSDSSWKDTRDGQFFLANTIVASKLNVAQLSAITASMGALNITDTLTMGASGEITNSGGDYTLDADGLSLTIGGTSAQTIEWLSGTTIYGSVNTSAAGELTLIGWDGTQRNIGITIGDGIVNKLNTTFEADVVVPDSTSATHALNTQTADTRYDARYIEDGTVSAGAGLGTPDVTVRIEVDGQLVDIEAHSV